MFMITTYRGVDTKKIKKIKILKAVSALSVVDFELVDHASAHDSGVFYSLEFEFHLYHLSMVCVKVFINFSC
jgi:hypothetical protein